jgi:hypothetical protein
VENGVMGLANGAEAEIRELRRYFEKSEISVDDFHQGMEKWVRQAQFENGDFELCATLLSELASCLSDETLRPGAWKSISRLASEWEARGDSESQEMLRTTILEVLAEPPEVEYTLELLFSLAKNAGTRWAVFAAYENYPWRLRPHARKYSRGLVTDDDCDQWLIDQDLGHDEILMNRD